MKRKTWVSLVCGGLLLVATAAPATAAGPGLAGPALVERVMEWLAVAGWLPAPGQPAQGPVESRVAAGKKGDEEPPPAPVVGDASEECTYGELDPGIDPNG